MTNVIPLFDHKTDRSERNTAVTHFAHPTVPESTLCGREFVGYLDSAPKLPECEACKEEHVESTGWSFPLPDIVTTA